MTDEEAKERAKILIAAGEECFKAFGECFITEDELEAVEIIFSLTNYQQTELEQKDNRIKELERAVEKKDKIIENMAEWIFDKDYTKNSLLIDRKDRK